MYFKSSRVCGAATGPTPVPPAEAVAEEDDGQDEAPEGRKMRPWRRKTPDKGQECAEVQEEPGCLSP